jgi:hypothetical protein
MAESIGMESNSAAPQAGAALNTGESEVRRGRLKIQVHVNDQNALFCQVCTCRCRVCVCRCIPR